MGWGSLREYLPCIMDYHAESYHRSEQLDLCSTQKRCRTLSCFWSRQLRWTTVPRRINPARQLITARSWATVVSTIQNITVLQPSISILERYLSRSEYDRVKEGRRIALEIRTVWKYSLYPISHKISTGKRQLTLSSFCSMLFPRSSPTCPTSLWETLYWGISRMLINLVLATYAIKISAVPLRAGGRNGPELQLKW